MELDGHASERAKRLSKELLGNVVSEGREGKREGERRDGKGREEKGRGEATCAQALTHAHNPSMPPSPTRAYTHRTHPP